MNHIHRWRIDEPNGPYSDGLCAGCGLVRTYGNSEETCSVGKPFGQGVLRIHQHRRPRRRTMPELAIAPRQPKRGT